MPYLSAEVDFPTTLALRLRHGHRLGVAAVIATPVPMRKYLDVEPSPARVPSTSRRLYQARTVPLAREAVGTLERDQVT